MRVHRERATTDFLGIKNENWQAASRALGATALRLYLYIAANADNFELALSPAAIERDIGMARSTYHDQFRKLINFGYIVPTRGNGYEFFETPQPRAADSSSNELPDTGLNFEEATADDITTPPAAENNSVQNTEINNTNITNNSLTNISVPKVKEITIAPPQATGSNRPPHIDVPKKEFVF